MKKLFTVLISLMILSAFAESDKRSVVPPPVIVKGPTAVPEITVNPTINSATGTWTTFDYAKVLVPANETGTVAITQLVMGRWQDLVTLTVTNSTVVPAIQDVEVSDLPVVGDLKLVFDQETGKTNSWQLMLLFK